MLFAFVVLGVAAGVGLHFTVGDPTAQFPSVEWLVAKDALPESLAGLAGGVGTLEPGADGSFDRDTGELIDDSD